MGVSKPVKEFAVAAFTLLGVLFGMMIMSFIFGNLGTSNVNSYADDTIQITNESVSWVNQTNYTVSKASEYRFVSFSVIQLYNVSSKTLIPLANITQYSTDGTFKASDFLYNSTNVSVTYVETFRTSQELTAEKIQNNSLNSVEAYTDQSKTQLTTVAIAITLILLVSVFIYFWKTFVSEKKKSRQGMEAGNFE